MTPAKGAIMVQGQNVTDVAASRLCCSCGACAWACPQHAITYVETVGGYLIPKINPAVCTECGICLSICPGIGLLPGVADQLPADPFTGIALDAYVGRAADEELYANSQSGGIVSALLAHALGTGEIAGAITTVMVEGTPPKAVARLAKNADDLQMAQKSKYCPVPLLSILSEVEKQDRPVAFVGVACQLHGLLNLCEHCPRLKAKIAFTIGLICDRIMTYGAISYFLRGVSVSKGECRFVHFKDKSCGGYPGNVHVALRDGSSVTLPSAVRLAIRDHFTPARCCVCFDKMNVLADITAGDPWGIASVNRVQGESVAVIRTEVGRRLFRNALDAGVVTARAVDYQEVLGGQRIERRRIDWRGYVEAWCDLGRPLPSYCDRVRPSSSPPEGRTALYRQRVREALSLDHYPTRDALINVVQRKLFAQELKRQCGLPLRKFKQMIRKVIERAIRRSI